MSTLMRGMLIVALGGSATAADASWLDIYCWGQEECTYSTPTIEETVPSGDDFTVEFNLGFGELEVPAGSSMTFFETTGVGFAQSVVMKVTLIHRPAAPGMILTYEISPGVWGTLSLGTAPTSAEVVTIRRTVGNGGEIIVTRGDVKYRTGPVTITGDADTVRFGVLEVVGSTTGVMGVTDLVFD